MIAISREKLANQIGVTPDTIRGWQDRYFTRGVEYFVIGRITLYCAQSVEDWLESQKIISYTTGPLKRGRDTV